MVLLLLSIDIGLFMNIVLRESRRGSIIIVKNISLANGYRTLNWISLKER